MKISDRFLLCFAVAFSVSQSFADDIRSTTGEVFRNAKILRSEPDGLVIQHSVGVAKVPFEELPISLQKHFGFDPDRAAAFRSRMEIRQMPAQSPVIQPTATPVAQTSLQDVIEPSATPAAQRSLQDVIDSNEQWIISNFGPRSDTQNNATDYSSTVVSKSYTSHGSSGSRPNWSPYAALLGISIATALTSTLKNRRNARQQGEVAKPTTLTDRIPGIHGEVIVITKTRFLFLFSRPRTSVMPHGFSDFGRRLGFQAVYRTKDPAILKQFHDYFVLLVIAGGFEAQLAAAKFGIIDFPQGYEHLKGYIIGFHA